MKNEDFKKMSLKSFINTTLLKTFNMFDWSGLPVDELELEKQLQENGYTVIFKYENDYYCLPANLHELNQYNQPTLATVTNAFLDISQTFKIGSDCVLVKNNYIMQPLTEILGIYGRLLSENQLTMLIADYNLRAPFIISASDDSTVESAKQYIQRIKKGDIGIIGSNKIFESLKINPNSVTSNFSDLYGYHNFINAELSVLLGLAVNNNMKKERLITAEIEANKKTGYPYVNALYNSRLRACDDLAAVFGLNVSVDFSSIWQDEQPTAETEDDNESEPETAETEDETENETAETEDE